MSENQPSTFRWIVGTVISLLAAGGGIAALLQYFGGEPKNPPIAPTENAKPKSVSRAEPEPGNGEEGEPRRVTSRWRSSQGTLVVLSQTGSLVTFQEYNGFGELTAEGTGTVNGNVVASTFTSTNGPGTARITVAADEQSANGTITYATGLSLPIRLVRD